MDAADVLRFWFEETGPNQWFTKNEEFDALVRSRFFDTYWIVVRGETEETWRRTPEGRVAEIVVLDQFARNMFRGTPQAFMYDPLALALAQQAVRAGDDALVTGAQRHFMYMPFMHSESIVIQRRSLDLFRTLGNEEALKYAQEHHDVIERFGRFPHRNAALGRDTTDSEHEFLKAHPDW